MPKFLIGALVAAFATPLSLIAAPLTEARVNKIVNEVKVIDPVAGNRDAKLNDVISNDRALTTGIKSRSELVFQDNTLTRLGPESYFSFKGGTRDMTLKQGTMLLQVPKGNGGAKIRTGAVTAAITGTTIMMEYTPQKRIKVMVLEGDLRLSVNGRFGDSLLLEAGRMVIMPPNAKHIPDPVAIDLKKLVRTSKLVNMGGNNKKGTPALPSMPLIEQEVARQQRDKNSNHLIDTNLVILGNGANVLLASRDLLQSLSQRTDVATAPSSDDTSVTPTPPPTPPPVVGDIGATPKVTLSDGGKKTEVRYGEKRLTSPLVLNDPRDLTGNHGYGNIRISSNDSVTVNSILKVSDQNSDKKKGEIAIDSKKTNGSAIAIHSTAQLLALLAAGNEKGGKITFQSAGGSIDVNGATLQADRGNIEMRNNGATGSVTLADAALNAGTIKIGALGNDGTLTVGGGSISADTAIKLYAGGGNGTVNFVDDVTLSGNSVKTIAGNTVSIFDGKVVTINGPAPANVFTNHPNYTGSGGNGSTTGTFAGQGAVTQPLSGKPGF